MKAKEVFKMIGGCLCALLATIFLAQSVFLMGYTKLDVEQWYLMKSWQPWFYELTGQNYPLIHYTLPICGFALMIGFAACALSLFLSEPSRRS